MSEEYTGKIVVKAKNGKGFKVEGNDNWFNAVDNVVPYLAKIDKGETVTITYEKKGVKQTVTKVIKAGGTSESKAPATTTEKKTWTPKKDYISKTNYGSPEDVAGKEVGCAANVAGSILSGRQEDIETLLEMWSILFNGVLERIRAKK